MTTGKINQITIGRTMLSSDRRLSSRRARQKGTLFREEEQNSCQNTTLLQNNGSSSTNRTLPVQTPIIWTYGNRRAREQHAHGAAQTPARSNTKQTARSDRAQHQTGSQPRSTLKEGASDSQPRIERQTANHRFLLFCPSPPYIYLNAR